MDLTRRIPFHPFFFAMYPILALLAVNISEVNTLVAVRPLLISLLGTVLILALLKLGVRNWRKAALLTTFSLVLFYSYGHLYQFLELTPIAGLNIGRHRYLIVAYSFAAVVGLWWLLRWQGDLHLPTQALNLAGILLLAFPLFQISQHLFRISDSVRSTVEAAPATLALSPPEGQIPPDIYYIILDSYTRGDALLQDLGFDNRPFLDELRGLGFYVADCSLSNYSYTQGTITTALNMEYLPALVPVLEARGLKASDIWVLLKNSMVRRQLEAIGYRTIAFDTGYEWSRLSDADIYLGLTRDPYNLQRIDPFEAMLIKSTAGLILTDAQYRSLAARSQAIIDRIDAINFPYQGFVERQLFILGELPRIPSIPGQKFIFVHLLVPHVPYVFGPNGELQTDPGFYGGKLASPVNDEYLREGYTAEIQFINQKMLEIAKQIIARSQVPPIIIIHGDHGLRKDNRPKILNAYYLPGEGSENLYPTISPVNSFRVIFDTYFGTDYGLLPDESYTSDDPPQLVPETSSECIY